MDGETFDAGLFGLWGQDGYCGTPEPEADDGRAAAAVFLELKSAEAAAGADLREILNGVTLELKAQMAVFTGLRRQAEAALDDDASDQKQARADLKAANDAISLIVRTLDKTDELQRKINDAREAAEERALDEARLDALCNDLNRHIEARIAEMAAGDGGGGAAGEPPRDDAPG